MGKTEDRKRLEGVGMVARKRREIDSQLASFLAGGLAGTVSSTITCPLEVVKTQLQGSLGEHGSGNAIHTVQRILANEGVRGLFRGLIPTIAGILPTRSLYFWSYSSSKHWLEPKIGDGALLHILAAAAAGVCSNTVTNPIWALKTRMQLQAGVGGYTGYPDAIRKILATEGISGFFRGLSASYWGVTEGAIHFVLYEKVKKRWLANKRAAATTSTAASSAGSSSKRKSSSKQQNQAQKQHQAQHDTAKLSSLQYLVAAACCKLIASAATYPHEVVRTRMREIPAAGQLPKYRSMIQSLTLIGKEEGRAGLYAGMGTHLARVVPNTALMFLTYETVVGLVERYNRTLRASSMNAAAPPTSLKVGARQALSSLQFPHRRHRFGRDWGRARVQAVLARSDP